MRTVILIGALPIFLNISMVVGWRPYMITADNLSYTCLQPEIVDLRVNIRTLDNTQFISGYANILKDIDEIFAHTTLQIDAGDGKFDLLHVNKTFNICELLVNPRLNVLASIAHKLVSVYVDIPKRCPIRKKFYKVDNATANLEILPPYLPDKKAQLSGSVWILQRGRKILLVKGSVVGTIERTYKKN